MCGIAGHFSPSMNAAALDATAKAMAERLRHRGPDADGVWIDGERGFAFSHRRLSIIDLSPAGAQPMVSAQGRYVTVFNGEIYNYRELRAELERLGRGAAWRGTSDTEVMLAAFEAWGVHAALERLGGMFALAVYDRDERTVHLARDRMGEKPLYYGWSGESFLFASQLKAFGAHPAWKPSIDRDALALFTRHGYIPAPYSIYEGVKKLPAASLLSIPLARLRDRWMGDPTPYWSLDDAVAKGKAHPFAGSDADAISALEALLGDAVRREMVADVPLGAFLSGGIDSSAIVAMMKAHGDRPVRTFTVGFREAQFDESRHARAVANHLGTEHQELYATAAEVLDTVPLLATIYDEPFADSSQVPTFLISKLTRSHVAVSLSGDGGDELFGGYNRHSWAPAIAESVLRWPASMRSGASSMLDLVTPRFADGTLGDKIAKLSGALGAADRTELYESLVSHWKPAARVVPGAKRYATVLDERMTARRDEDDYAAWMMQTDALTYLPDDILTKVDRAAMSVGLETRVPLLDHRVVEFAWSLPMRMKIRDGQGKWVLREVLFRHVPRDLFARPKMGFAAPIDQWLRGPLKDWAEALLDESRLRREGWFDPAAVRRKWEEHSSRRRNWHHHLWDILMFQAWLESPP